MKKYITIVVILLFIGLAFAPSIHANIRKEMVEFTTEVCGLDGGKQTVKLTQDEAEEVDVLFKSIRERLNETETREEAEQVFKDAVVELDKYGLLGGLSIKQAQRLVTGGYQNPIINRILDRIYDKNLLKLDDDENMFCLIAGKTSGTSFLHRKGLVSLRLVDFLFFLNNYGLWTFLVNHIKNDLILETMFYFVIFHILRYRIYLIFSNFIPYSIGGMIYLGSYSTHSTPSYAPAQGWLFTTGLNRNKNWTGKFYGHLSFANIQYNVPFGVVEKYPGVRSFTGIKLRIRDFELFYLGSAFKVKIGESHP